MNFLFLFDTTGFAAEPFTDMGHNTTIVDILNVGQRRFNGRASRVLDWDILQHEDDLAEIAKECAFVFGFPPCTHLSTAGAMFWPGKAIDNPNFQNEAVHLCRSVERIGNAAGVPWCAENPQGKLNTLWRKPDFTFSPHEYGGYLLEGEPHPLYPKYFPSQDAYRKKTCLWSSPDFRFPPKKPVELEEEFKKKQKYDRLFGGRSGPESKIIKSCSPRGFFTALASLYAPEYAL